MDLPLLRRLTLCSLIAALGGCFPLGCGPSEPMGQFGAYHAQNKTLRLPSGEQLTVYRVKSWTFSDGSPPALQLEYEMPGSVADTEAVRRYGRTVWPVFVRYLDTLGYRGAIVTATNFHRGDLGGAWASGQRSFGLIASRGDDGRWRFDRDTLALPLADRTPGSGIFEYNGTPLLVGAIRSAR